MGEEIRDRKKGTSIKAWGDSKDKKIALLDDSMHRITYGELKQKIISVGKYLKARQLAVIEMGNNMDSVIFYFGCLFAEMVAILGHENLSEFELSDYIEKFQPEYLFLSMKTGEIILDRTDYL